MEMIIGGAFQGKSAYARETHPEVDWKNGADLEKEDLMTADGVMDFQEYIKKELKADQDVTDLAEELSEKNPDIILVSQEVGYGVVPMDAEERAGREAAGRLACLLAERADCVVQMFCGIPTVLKGELPKKC